MTASLLLSAAAPVQLSDSQCTVLRQMRVNTRGQCPEHITARPVAMRSIQADEANYNPAVRGVTNAGSGADRPAGSGGVSGPDAGDGSVPGTPGTPGRPDPPSYERPGGGGDARPGVGRPPIRPPEALPGRIVVKPGGGTIVIPDFDLSLKAKKELLRRIIKRNNEDSDFVQPDRPKGKARQGRNSR